MQSLTKLYTTVRLIRISLFPQKAVRYYSAEIETLAQLFSDASASTLHTAKAQLFIPSAWPIAAPFILFRLKRSGFSNCRVTAVNGGLEVTATR